MDVEKILRLLTVEEKATLMQAKDNWSLNGIERLGIPSVILTDGPNGVRLMEEDGRGTKPSTAIPTESILSSSWDEDLIEKLGEMMAEECQYYNIGILLGPGVNAKRSPLGGRNFEYYSEDPYLSGKLAAALIRGVQKNGVGTSLKHYVANDQETRRFTMDANVDERTLREICLRPFEIAIKESAPWTVMAAYPKLRGQHLCENSYVLETVLRKEYGYTGTVLSDWSATINKAASHKNGLDLETGSYARKQELIDSVRNGDISIETIDEHVKKILELIDKVIDGRKQVPADWDSHHELSREAARKSAVLLKNEGDILPLSENEKIAVLGKFAQVPHFKGGGSSGTNPQKLDIPYECIAKYASADYSGGYETEAIDEQLIADACTVAKEKEAVIIFIGTTDLTESEGSDRKDMSLPESHIALVESVSHVNENVVVINSSGSAVELKPIEKFAKAILHIGLAGEGGGAAAADILFGKTNPSGKLTETFPIRLEHTPTYPFFPGNDDNVIYHEELFVGYRYYDTKKMDVQYPFGHGLSYTDFTYSNLVCPDRINASEHITIKLDVTNTGNCFGEEVVQIYVTDEKAYLIRPAKELKGFTKVALNPKETKTLEIELDDYAFSYYVPHLGRYAAETGNYIIHAAASSRDIRLSQTVFVTSDEDVRLPLNQYNTMGEFYRDDRYADATKEVYEFYGITEDNMLFPIIDGITLKDLPAFFSFMQIPPETVVQSQQMILNSHSPT